jgi:hypothetical protein
MSQEDKIVIKTSKTEKSTAPSVCFGNSRLEMRTALSLAESVSTV